ncbi:autotransporter outer membrane beta-barrel domain-containing protein [Pseudomonas chlororaphis]|uniref:Autotransporter outer membrane beta-barrel domain-containing protein n=1 Tax=Pseudomonas chlororaphis TaxID=587753 RepID=A0A1Q8EU60_9PSED|nr:autotransporter outer membrane beta-barrel domain-containing protein [Pseudomonas chlororaphis]
MSTAEGENRKLLPGDTVTHTGPGAAITISGNNNALSGQGVAVQSGVPGTGSNIQGIKVQAGGSLDLSDGSINTLGEHTAQALVVNGAGSQAVLNDMTLKTEGAGSYAVHASGGGRVEITGGSVDTQGNSAYGLFATGNGTTISASNVLITTLGRESSGVRVEDGAHIVLDRAKLNTQDTSTQWGSKGLSVQRASATATNSNIVSAGGMGIYLSGGSVSFTNGSVDAYRDGVYLATPSYSNGATPPTSSIELRDAVVRSRMGFGLNINSHDARATLERVTIGTNGDYGSGIWLPSSNSQVTARDSRIETEGRSSLGVDNRAGTFTMDGGSITTHGASAHGLYASFQSYDGKSSGAANTVRNVAIETFGNNAAGVVSRTSGASTVLEGGSVTTHGENAYAMLANAASLKVTGTRVRTHGDFAPGLRMGNRGAAASLDGVDLQTSGKEAVGIMAYSSESGLDNTLAIRNSLIATEDGHAIEVAGSGFIAELNDSTVIGRSRTGDGVLLHVGDLNSIAARDVQLNAQRSRLEGDVLLDSGSASLNLRDHSQLIGTLRDNAGRTVDNLSIDDSSAWHMRGDSKVAQLDNAGTLSFVTPDSAFKVLDVSGNLSGGGLFEMRTDLGAGQGDRLRVAGTVEGTHRVLVRNSGAEPKTGGETLNIIQTGGGPGSFVLANRNQVIDAGTYRYELKKDPQGQRKSSSDWSLVNTHRLEPKPEPETTPKPDPEIKPEPPTKPQIIPPATAHDLSTTANAAIDTSAASTVQAIWHAEKGTLVKRLGELRQGQDKGGVWTRGFGERQKLDNHGGRAFEQTVSGLQVGIDKALPVENGRWYVGVMSGISTADRRFAGEGKGNADSYQLGGYATWLGDNGWYLDSVLKANRVQQDFKVVATDGQSVKAKSHQHALGLSLEAGRQMPLGAGWFVEPQVELSTVHVGGTRYHASNGLQVDAGSDDSTQLRVGSRLGQRYELSGGGIVQPYIKLGRAQELDGKSSVRTNGIATRTDLSGGRTELGLGVSASLNNSHQLYADYEHASGSRLDRPWAVSAGYRYSW